MILKNDRLAISRRGPSPRTLRNPICRWARMVDAWVVDAVSEAPGGAYPSYAHGISERDNDFYKQWDELSRDRDAFRAYMEEHVL